MSNASSMLKPLAGPWLALQCQMIPSVARGAIFLGSEESTSQTPSACWPHDNCQMDGLRAAARLALEKKSPVVGGSSERSSTLSIASPLLVDGEFVGIVAVEAETPNEQQQRAIMQLLQWGSTWFEFLVQREIPVVGGSLATVVGIVATSLEHEQFHAAATATATELAVYMASDRVSIGFRDHRHTQVTAISHSVKFSERANLIRDIGMAMDEALDQQCSVVYPLSKEESLNLTGAHEGLVATHGNAAVCTVPLGNNGRLCGAITFERGESHGFDEADMELGEVIGSILGPILEIKRKEDRWLVAKVADSVSAEFRKVFGPRHVGLKLATLAVSGLIAFLALTTSHYRVSADAVLEGTVQRVVVAPMDGYIAAAQARAGDLVREGELLGSLDSTDLELELVRWDAQHKQLAKKYRKALANRDRSQTRILKAQTTQAEAQIQLLEDQLSRTEFVSPFDGMVVSGDLSQALGSPVERGEVLFEIAPLDSYRVMLEVEEQEISSVAVGQSGHLSLAGFPGERMLLHVEKITPVSTNEKGKNFFRVEARLDASPVDLRPGMQGVGKIEIEERKLLWIWTYKLSNWIRVWVWSWWP